MSSSIDNLNIALKRAIAIMLLLLLIVCGFAIASNIFYIKEGYVGIQLRFGKIIGNDNALIFPGGPHFALPEPVDKVLIFPTTLQSVTLDEEFFYSRSNSAYSGMLTPGRDGSLITGDKNIVHGQWAVDYQLDIANLRCFAENVGSLKQAEKLLKSIISRAVIQITSRTSVDNFIKGDIDNNDIKQKAQKYLDALNSGIILKHVTSTSYEVPQELRGAFLFVNEAESTKATRIETAQKYREAMLNQAAGSAWLQLIEDINAYEKGDKSKTLTQIFNANNLAGEISMTLNDAQNYKTTNVQKIKSSAERFNRLLKEYEQNPNILKNRLLQDALQEIMAGKVKKYYLPKAKDKTIYIDLKDMEN